MNRTKSSSLPETSLSTQDLKKLDSDHHLHPFTDHQGLHQEGGSRIIVKADDCYLWDSEGLQIIDGMAGLWCVNVGYGRKEIAERAYRQMQELPYYNTFFKTATPSSIQLASVLAEMLPKGFDKVFFNNSGSEANDTVYRLIHHFWNLENQPRKKTIISRRNAYHGSTVIGASLGGMESMHQQADLPVGNIVHIEQPYWYGQNDFDDPDEFGLHAARALEREILDIGPEQVAAFIGEPVQGAGGVVIPPATYWPEINRICRKYDVLLVCDEVICGFGRTGNWFGYQTFGIEPDLITMAKGLSSGYLPISAVGVGGRIADCIVAKGGEFAHGFTYSGHPACCAAALANIEIIKQEDLVGRVRRVSGPALTDLLRELRDHPLVGEVRSVGLLGAVELVSNKNRRTRYQPPGRAGTVCRDYCMAHNIVLRACGDTMVMAPPLTVTEEILEELIGKLRTSLDRSLRELSA